MHLSMLPSTMGNASASRKYVVFEAQWLAYTLPCRRFTLVLADDGARLRVDVDRYSFIAVDLHHLLFAGLPAHTHPTRYSNEGAPREAPHVHVKGGVRDAKIWIEPEVSIADSYGFNSRELSAILRIVAD